MTSAESDCDTQLHINCDKLFVVETLEHWNKCEPVLFRDLASLKVSCLYFIKVTTILYVQLTGVLLQDLVLFSVSKQKYALFRVQIKFNHFLDMFPTDLFL